MESAQHDQVFTVGIAAVHPVLDVMDLNELVGHVAAWEAAVHITEPDCFEQGRWYES